MSPNAPDPSSYRCHTAAQFTLIFQRRFVIYYGKRFSFSSQVILFSLETHNRTNEKTEKTLGFILRRVLSPETNSRNECLDSCLLS